MDTAPVAYLDPGAHMARKLAERQPIAVDVTLETTNDPKPRTLQRARQEFVAAVNRDTHGSDRERLMGVLDALIAWSNARPKQVRFAAGDARSSVLSFERADTGEVLWTATAVRGGAPHLSLIPRSSRKLPPAERSRIVDSLNELSRTAMADESHLRIGFGALKNEASRKAVLQLLETFLPTGSA